MTVTIHFHGASGTVTGPAIALSTRRGSSWSIAACSRATRRFATLNYKPLPFDAKAIDFLLLTHAHIDHAGLLPKLTKNGYRKPIWCTGPTAGLLEYLLPDAAGIQESEAEYESRKRGRKGNAPLEPLYQMRDAEQALALRQTLDYEQWIEPGPGVRARYWNAGHILGSASIEVEVKDGDKTATILFSGDLGPDEKVFYKAPNAPSGFDYILSESTYGGRERQDYTLDQRREALQAEINGALQRGGNLVIPAFAVERSQELLHDIGLLIKDKAISPSLVFLDSPLASKVTAVYKKYAGMFEDVELSADELFKRSALPHRRGGRGQQGHQPDQGRRHHHVGVGHVRCRPHQAPPRQQSAARQRHRAVRRLPGAGHARPDHPVGRQDRPHPRRGNPGARPHPLDGQLFGACRPFRADGLDHRPPAGAWRDLPDAWRGRGARRPAPGAAGGGPRR